jgi:serine O-acetyltransferase
MQQPGLPAASSEWSVAMFADGLMEWLETEDGFCLREDIDHWSKWYRFTGTRAENLERFMNGSYGEFRTLFDYRCEHSTDGKPFKAMLPKRRRANDLNIVCDSIGPRMFIQHGHSTWVLAKSIGSDFTVNQNVTIGATSKGRPTIGSRVFIRASCVVTGPITIGDDVRIAPTAFVNFDVPSRSDVFAPRAIIQESRRFAGKRQ